MRHGQTFDNVNDDLYESTDETPLTELGIEQVKLTAKVLKAYNIKTIYCSPLLRAADTAEIVGNELKIKPQVREELREVDAGIMKGVTRRAFKSMRNRAMLEKWMDKIATTPLTELAQGDTYASHFDRVARLRRGETFSDVMSRAKKAARLFKYNDRGDILIVTHEIFINAILHLLKKISFVGVRAFGAKYSNCHLTVLTKGHAIELLKYNDFLGAL